MKRFRVHLLVVHIVPLLLWAQGTYYAGIDTGSATFVTDLHNLIYPHTQISYAQFDETNIANFASRDTTGGQKVVTCVYSGQNYVYTPPFAWGTFSREHTWCYSWMPTYGSTSGKEYSDQHHLFPTNQNNANGVRSNHPLGVVATVTSSFLESKYGKNSSGQNVFEPRDSHKGDAARALLYMAVCYHGVNGNDWTFDHLNTVTLPALSEAAQDVDLLVQWHNQDPPDDWEKARNEYVYSIQGNRNPFVDHPEYVSVINFNTLTKKNSGTAPPLSSGGISITSLTFSYTENFDALSDSGTDNVWTDTTTLYGWYASRTKYNAGTGSSNIGALYSFGTASETARSLGSVASNSTSTIFYAVRFANHSGSTITSIPIQYTGKQWRNGGNTSPQKLLFEYKINASSINDAGTWTAVPSLDFTSPVATATAGALDGNDAANKTVLSAVISLTLLNGEEIWFRWRDIDDTGNDHGLAIDDFMLNPSGSLMPVELTSFTATMRGKNVELKWATATEVNNLGFEIERTVISNQQSAISWSKIGFVEGNGNSNAPKEYSYSDKTVKPGTHLYRLKQIDRDGKFSYSQAVEVTIGSVPNVFALEQNYPNPFNPITTIGFTLQVSGLTTLKIYDALGREVATLVNENLEAGYYQRTFNASNLASGIYFAKLSSADKTQIKKLMLIK
jgi:endonuclease I